MLHAIKNIFHAATQLPALNPPKVKGTQTALPSYMPNANPNPNSPLLQGDRRLAATDIAQISRSQSTKTVVRELAHSSPDISAAMFSYIRTAVTGTYNATAKNLDGTFNPEGTMLVQQLLVRFDVLQDYSQGFGGTSSMRSNSESLAKEIFMYGSCSAELILGPDRLPRRIQPISTANIEFWPKGNLLKPVQRLAGVVTSLDIPTFFYTALDQELQTTYSSSPVESSIQATLFAESFMADLRRVIKRSLHPRLVAVIDEDKFKKNMPAEALHDAEAFAAYRAQTLSSIEDAINNLNPEDALVTFDSIAIDLLRNGNTSLSKEYEVLGSMANAKMATGAKTMPSILGHATGSSNIASTETLLFMRNVEGAVQGKLNELYSRILTLAVRMFGLDVYVEFEYDPISLRPKEEMEAFKQTKQSRILELLSIGMITDEEASIQLTGYLPPPGTPKLSGTMFKSNQAPVPIQDTSSNGGSTFNQKTKSDAPSQAGGQNNKADPQALPKGK